ncbi:hypothetical protein [Streptomyces pseudoechinosporeus]
MRGKVTSESASPLPVVTSDSFTPDAFTRIPRPARLHRGQGTSLTTSLSTPPGSDSTMRASSWTHRR